MNEIYVCKHIQKVFMGKDDFDACAMRMKDGMCFRFNKGLPCDAVKYVREQVGKWEYNGNMDELECSVCKESHFIGATDYCPSCGARMEEE